MRAAAVLAATAVACTTNLTHAFFAPPLPTRAAAVTATSAPTALRMTVSSDLKGKERLEKYLRDCELMGPVRFVCMTDGAILEAVGSFENLRFNQLDKGLYATLSDDDTGFECHLNMDAVAGVNMLTKPSKDGSHELYITRFVDKEGKTLLSAMLHGDRGEYEEGAVPFWNKLRDAFGEEQRLQ